MKALLLTFVFLLLAATPAFAAISINEISSSSSPDWVEIYNTSTESAQLNNYLLRDSTDSDSNKHTLSGTLGPGAFQAIDVSNELNNGGDKVRLFRIENGAEILVEELAYGENGGTCAPSDTQSIGRSPDGGVTVVRFAASTKNAANSTSIDACPAPTATPTQGPTNTPTPAATSTSVPSATAVPTVRPTARPTPSPTIVALIPTVGEEEFVNSQLLNLNDSPPPEITPEVLGESTTKSNSIWPIVIIGVGVLGLVVSLVLLFLHSRKSASDSGPINLS